MIRQSVERIFGLQRECGEYFVELLADRAGEGWRNRVANGLVALSDMVTVRIRSSDG